MAFDFWHQILSMGQAQGLSRPQCWDLTPAEILSLTRTRASAFGFNHQDLDALMARFPDTLSNG